MHDNPPYMVTSPQIMNHCTYHIITNGNSLPWKPSTRKHPSTNQQLTATHTTNQIWQPTPATKITFNYTRQLTYDNPQVMPWTGTASHMPIHMTWQHTPHDNSEYMTTHYKQVKTRGNHNTWQLATQGKPLYMATHNSWQPTIHDNSQHDIRETHGNSPEPTTHGNPPHMTNHIKWQLTTYNYPQTLRLTAHDNLRHMTTSTHGNQSHVATHNLWQLVKIGQ